MKAAVLRDTGIECEEFPYPSLGDNSVIVKVAYCGICGSDIPRVNQGTAHHYPLILGHEFSGTVVEVGKNVDPRLLNKHVVGVPLIPCNSCNSCKSGLFSLCNNYSFIGSRVNGAYAEYVSVPEKNVCVVPDELSLIDVATIEPCTVAYHALSMVDLVGKRVAIIGSGIIGLFAIQLAKCMGSKFVTLVVHKKKSFDKTDVFADAIVESDSCEKDIADVVIDCAGTNDSIITCFNLSCNRGEIILIGTPTTNMLFEKKQWEIICRKELSVRGSWMSYSNPFPGEEWIKSIEMLRCNKVQVIPEMISVIKSLDEISSIFQDIYELKKKGRVLLKISDE